MQTLFRLGRGLVRRGLRLFEPNPDAYLKQVKGVIHVGAHEGQEREIYARYDVDVLWIEPLPEVFSVLSSNLKSFPKQRAVQYLVTECDGKSYPFHIADNDGGSSSIFAFAEHKKMFPEVTMSRVVTLTGTTLPTLIKKEGIDIRQYDALVMDTQGSELLVLKGASDLLHHFKFVKSEAADFELYEGCCMLNDLTQFLSGFGFVQKRRYLASWRDGVKGRCYDVLYQNRATR